MTDLESRRRALVLASQLPPGPKDRRRVLDHMRRLAQFLDGELDEPEQRQAAE